jgi:hypothetical protein
LRPGAQQPHHFDLGPRLGELGLEGIDFGVEFLLELGDRLGALGSSAMGCRRNASAASFGQANAAAGRTRELTINPGG